MSEPIGTITFTAGEEELIKITEEGFYYKGEKVDDKDQVYARLKDWLDKATLEEKS